MKEGDNPAAGQHPMPRKEPRVVINAGDPKGQDLTVGELHGNFSGVMGRLKRSGLMADVSREGQE